MKTLNQTKNLELKLKSDRCDRTSIIHQHTAYPFRLSPTFRLDTADPKSAYIYMMSASPGLLAGDELNISLQLANNTSLYLTDQAATNVHSISIPDTKAITNYEIEIGESATLEFVPEPLILFKDSALQQTTRIKIHPTGNLFLSEIIVPGRLAREEIYDFHYYCNRLEVSSTEGELWFTDAMRLEGKLNPFKNSDIFASAPILGNAIALLPKANLELLREAVEDLEIAKCSDIVVASSILPQSKGLLIRAIAKSTHELKKYQKYTLNCVRRFCDRSPLPHIPK